MISMIPISCRHAVKRPLYFRLPRKCVNDFVEMQSGLRAGKDFALGIGELQVRH